MFGFFSSTKIKRVKVPCEYCSWPRIADVPWYMDWEAHAEEDFPERFQPHIFVKCPNCRKQIGILLFKKRRAG